MPFGKVTATYKIGDEVHEATGRGYHDHNWTNTDLGHLIDHWWWARGEVGPYTFLAAHIVAAEKYGYTPFHWYMLARDGKVIADDGSKMSFTTHGAEINEKTGKPVPDAVCFDYQDGDTRYELTITRQKTLVAYTWIDFAKGWEKELMKLIRYPGGYMRFLAATDLDCYKDGELVEHYEKTGSVRADLLPARDPRGVAGARPGPLAARRSSATGGRQANRAKGETMDRQDEPARLAADPEDYARFEIAKGHIEPWRTASASIPQSPTWSGGTSTRCWTTAPNWR